MARPTLKEHFKFKRLCRVLGLPIPYVIGHLECMWHVGYGSGDPFLGDSISVEAAAEWVGESGKLCSALLDCGFIDQDEAGNYLIHDLHDHAPDYVAKRFKREQQRKNKDLRSIVRRSADNGGQCPPNGGQRRTTAQNGCPPTPTPAPAPTQEQENIFVADATVSAVADEKKEPDFRLESGEEQKNSPPYKEIASAWNKLAGQVGIPAIRELTEQRKRAIRVRWASREWREDWREALERIRGSPWHLGENKDRWTANFDWFLQPKSVGNLMSKKTTTDDDIPF